MNTLALAAKVAAHPVMVKLRARQNVLRRLFASSYGDDFMISGQDMPEMILPNGRTSPRFEGVHYWTPAQRAEWAALETRAHNARTALKAVYSAA